MDINAASANGDPVAHLHIWDKDKRTVFPEISLFGVVVSLCKQGKILLLDTSTHHAPGPSFLLSEDAQALMRTEFGVILNYGVSDDNKIFWVRSRSPERGKAEVVIRVYSYDGHQLLERSVSSPTSVQVICDDIKYIIKVMGP
jgi:hypothetical protein